MAQIDSNEAGFKEALRLALDDSDGSCQFDDYPMTNSIQRTSYRARFTRGPTAFGLIPIGRLDYGSAQPWPPVPFALTPGGWLAV